MKILIDDSAYSISVRRMFSYWWAVWYLEQVAFEISIALSGIPNVFVHKYLHVQHDKELQKNNGIIAAQ